MATPTPPGQAGSHTGRRPRVVRRPLLWIAVAALPFFLVDPGGLALSDGEAMYAEVPREMRAGGDWITPRLNGSRHFDKPILIYWLIGASQAVFGERELAARVWPALATWATIPVVGAIGATLFGARAGWLGALAFAASLGPYIFGRQAMPDGILCLWIALALLGFMRGYVRGGEGRGAWPWLMYLSLGLAALTKGILGIALPATIIGLHIVAGGRLRPFLSWRVAAGLGISAAVALPWHVAVARANPDFLGYYVIREHFLRFTGQRYPADEALGLPLFLLFTLVWTFPWSFLVPQALGRAGKRLWTAGFRKGGDLLPLLWIGVVVGLFAASRSRLEYYALPAMPAFALVIGKLWDEALAGGMLEGSDGRVGAGDPQSPSRRALGVGLAAMAGLMAVAAVGAFVVLGPGKGLVFRTVAASWEASGWTGSPEQAAVLDRIRIPTLLTLAGAATTALGALAAMRSGRRALSCGLLAGMMAPLFGLVQWGFAVMEPFQSMRPIAQIVQRAAGPDDPVVVQEPYEYMWVGGLAYYTKRALYILRDPKFEGLAVRRREPADRFLDRKALEALWSSGRRVVVVADEGSDLEPALARIRPVEVAGGSGGRVVLRPRAPAQ